MCSSGSYIDLAKVISFPDSRVLDSRSGSYLGLAPPTDFIISSARHLNPASRHLFHDVERFGAIVSDRPWEGRPCVPSAGVEQSAPLSTDLKGDLMPLELLGS